MLFIHLPALESHEFSSRWSEQVKAPRRCQISKHTFKDLSRMPERLMNKHSINDTRAIISAIHSARCKILFALRVNTILVVLCENGDICNGPSPRRPEIGDEGYQRRHTRNLLPLKRLSDFPIGSRA